MRSINRFAEVHLGVRSTEKDGEREGDSEGDQVNRRNGGLEAAEAQQYYYYFVMLMKIGQR